MIRTTTRILCALLVLTSGFFVLPSAFGQTDSILPSNRISTGYSYIGIEGGVTGTEYLGAHNFLWGIVTSTSKIYNAPEIATYVPFTNLGTGVGFVGGAKLGLALCSDFDLEAKFRFITNYSSRTEFHSGILLDPYVPSAVSGGTNTYSLLLSSLDAALLGHLRISDYYYVAGGFSASELTKNGFTVSQHMPGGFVNLITHAQTTITDQQTPEEQIDNWFYGTRFDAQVGLGAVTRLGVGNLLLDAELLVSIPFTQWLTKVADSSLNATATEWHQPAIIDPHLWYATLTIGLRLPFHALPPPIPEVAVVPPLRKPVPKPKALHIVTAPPIIEKNGVIMLSGKVTDAKTGKPLDATLTTVNLANNNIIDTVHTDANGNYKVRVSGPGKYSVTATAKGHLFGTALFDVDSEGRILSDQPNIALSPSTSGGKTRLLVFFDFDKADLQPSSKPELDRAVELMKQVPAMKVEIAGYSDSIGSLEHNLDLSLRRANAVRDFLIRQGVAPGRITAQGYGPASPIATNATDEGRAQNRRVEFVVKGQ